MTSPGQLATDLQNLDLTRLQARIERAADLETVLPPTDERLQEIEEIRATITALQDALTRARNRAVARAVASRWTYERICKATGLSTTRIGQIAPARAGRNTPAD
jgi:uncharacterized protein YerC